MRLVWQQQRTTITPKAEEDLPVVARLVVEVRSDGTRVVARGAMEDKETGQRVAVEARAEHMLELAAALFRLALSAPQLARQARHALRKRLQGG